MSFNLISDNNDYYFEIYLPSGSSAQHHTYFLERPSLEYKTGGDNESIFFPGSLKLKFFSDYPGLFDKLYEDGVILTLYENNQAIFKGEIDIEEISYNPNSQEYEITVIDFSQKFKEMPYDTISEYVGNTNITLITDILSRILSELGISLATPIGMNALTAESEYYEPISGSFLVKDFNSFGSYPSYFFDGYYKSLLDVLEGIASSFGFIGVFKGSQFEIRFRFSSSPTTIGKEKISYDIEMTKISAYDYLVASVRDGSSIGRLESVKDLRTIHNVDPKKQITYNYEIPAGTLPNGNGFNNLYVFLSDYEVGLGNGGWYNTHMDAVDINSSGNKAALWKKIFDAAADRIGKSRTKITAEIFDKIGLYETITFNSVNYIVTEASREIGKSKTKITALEI